MSDFVYHQHGAWCHPAAEGCPKTMPAPDPSPEEQAVIDRFGIFEDKVARSEITFHYEGNRWAALVLAVICIALIVTALCTRTGPWALLARYTGVFAFFLALKIDLKARGRS